MKTSKQSQLSSHLLAKAYRKSFPEPKSVPDILDANRPFGTKLYLPELTSSNYRMYMLAGLCNGFIRASNHSGSKQLESFGSNVRAVPAYFKDEKDLDLVRGSKHGVTLMFLNGGQTTITHETTFYVPKGMSEYRVDWSKLSGVNPLEWLISRSFMAIMCQFDQNSAVVNTIGGEEADPKAEYADMLELMKKRMKL